MAVCLDMSALQCTDNLFRVYPASWDGLMIDTGWMDGWIRRTTTKWSSCDISPLIITKVLVALYTTATMLMQTITLSWWLL